ncbi:MAG: PD-(D/E)XK nuclease family protein, partial [Candidatus Sumerlaeia bacterium]|nr:PD-(D/E)XK nuclease family protein [Candidatus Sumerlaeia bacterium]
LDGGGGRYLFQRLDQMMEDMAMWVANAMEHLPFRPVAEEVVFGSRGPLPPIRIDSGPDSPEVVLRGQLDRLDVVPNGDAAVVVDYKLHRKTFDYRRWECGEALQLPIYLLALAESEWEGRPLRPMGALYAGIVAKTLEENTFSDRAYEGIMNHDYLEGIFPGGTPWKTPPLGRSGNDPRKGPTRYGPHVVGREFDALLERTRAIITSQARDILAGCIDVAPSRHGTMTACAICSARPVCGIDYRLNKARHRVDRDRVAILADLRGPEDDGT